MNKPKFNPNAAFEPAAESSVSKPKFNPNQEFEPATATATTPVIEKPKTGILETLGMKAANGASFGNYDEVEGILGGVSRGAKNLFTDTGDKSFIDAVKNGYQTDKNAARAYQHQMSKDNPVTSVVGELLPALPALGAKGAISIGSMVKQGAVSGFGNSEEEDLLGMAKDTAIGGGISGALGGAAAGISKGVSKLGSSLNELKNDLALKAVGGQKGNLKHVDRAFKNDMGQYALENGLVNPLQGTTAKQELAEQLGQGTGARLNEVRDSLPSFDKAAVLNTIKSKMDFNPDLGINAARKSQLDTVLDDLEKRAVNGKIPAKDLLDYKSELFPLARKSNGEVNPVKDVLENARRGISAEEQALAGTAQYSRDLKDYAMVKHIQNLLDNKASQSGNSLLGMGGMIGGAGGAGAAIATGNPEYAALGLLGSPGARGKMGEIGAQVIHKSQKALNLPAIKQMVESGKLDPKIAAYLISREQ